MTPEHDKLWGPTMSAAYRQTAAEAAEWVDRSQAGTFFYTDPPLLPPKDDQ